MNKNSNLAIFIDSFDGYSDLWDVFFKIFNYYWSDCCFKRYLVNNTLDFDDSRIISIKTGPEINWFHRTINALEYINEEYILFMLEDYFISKKPENSDFIEIVDYMKKNDVFFYMITPCEQVKKTCDSYRVQVSSKNRYQINLQMAIWKRDKFLSILKEIQEKGGKSPWDFENYFANKYYINENEFFLPGVLYDLRDILGYKNGVLQGKWIRSTIKFYKRVGIKINTGNREIMSLRSTFYYTIKNWAIKHIPIEYIPLVRKFMKKLGFKFITD